LNNAADWTDIYCRFLALSIGDPIFHAERFGRLPIKFLRTCLQRLIEAHQEQVNAHSVATAKLAILVYSALGGKSHKVKIGDFLPYEMQKGDSGLKESTLAAMRWALKNQKLPPSIVGLLGAELG
jgi:hypothetical protein